MDTVELVTVLEAKLVGLRPPVLVVFGKLGVGYMITAVELFDWVDKVDAIDVPPGPYVTPDTAVPVESGLIGGEPLAGPVTSDEPVIIGKDVVV